MSVRFDIACVASAGVMIELSILQLGLTVFSENSHWTEQNTLLQERMIQEKDSPCPMITFRNLLIVSRHAVKVILNF